MPTKLFRCSLRLVLVLGLIASASSSFCQSVVKDSIRHKMRIETDEDTVRHICRSYKHSLMLGRGGSSTDAMFDGNKPAGIATNGYEHRPLPGAISLTYRTRVGRRVELGAAFVCENDRGRLYFISWSGSRNSHSTWVGSYKRMVYTIAPEFTYIYSQNEFSATYGSLALGISYQNDVHIFDEGYFYRNYTNGSNWLGYDIQQVHNRFHANFQVTAIGWRYARRLGCFAELGMGYKGILCLGASYNFRNLKQREK